MDPAMTSPPLSPQLLVRAYAQGLFPMARGRHGPIDWYSPDPRAILPLSPPEAFHLSHSLRQRLRRGEFLITRDLAFERVICACSQPRVYEESTWINPAIIRAYTGLHRLGLAHSVEAWPVGDDGQPAIDRRKGPSGGLYGVALGGAFFAESMFHRQTDAGKVALVHLVEHLRRQGFLLCDVQWLTPNLGRFGAFELPRAEYLQRLTQALARPAKFL
jgi:leucyl/phenylalanyl-tRNA---protein transferase